MEYIMVEQHIDLLEKQLRQEKELNGDDFKEMWGLVKVIGAGFKAYQWNTREAKEAAWTRNQALVEELKIANDEFRIRYEAERIAKNAEWEQKREQSTALRETIIEEANSVLEAGKDSEQPLKAKSEAMQQVRNRYRDNREQILREDGELIRAKLDEVADKLSQEWDAFKVEQAQKFKEREAKRLQSQQEWHERQKQFFRILEEKLYRKESLLKIVQNELEELLDKLSTAQSQTYKEKGEAWATEKRARIVALEQEILGIKVKLADKPTE